MDIEILKDDKYLESNDCIFHYTKLSTALENIIESTKLKYSSLRNTNDPKEYKDIEFNVAGWGNNSCCNKNDVSKTQSYMTKIWKDESRLLCFCQNLQNEKEHDIYGYSKSRMWSQYADDHRGVCFAFSKTKMINDLQETINTKENVIFHENVFYGKNRINCRTIERDNIVKYGPETCAFKHIEMNYKELFFLKNYDYKDENEYRIVLLSRKANNTYLDISKSLKAIIIGDNFPITYLPIIEKYCTLNNIIARKLYWADWKPELIPLKEFMKFMEKK